MLAPGCVWGVRMNRAIVRIPATAILALLILSSCGSANGGATQDSSRSALGGKQGAGPASKSNSPLGVNVGGIQWGSRVFMNLIYASSWSQELPSGGGWVDVPADALDANGWVKSAPAGAQIHRQLYVPLNSGNFVCRYQGNGTLLVLGPGVSNVTSSAGATRFSLATTYPNPQPAFISYAVDPANYIRNINCREANASATTTIAPDYAAALANYRTIRFLNWQAATPANTAVSWATRNKPGDGDYTRNDGVPIEVLVDTANQAGADLFVTVPWNADDDYVTRFATYVRDNLASNHRVYVEVSNEVWNGSFPVAGQAAKEAQTEGLASASGSGTAGNLERYAEKTEQVMAIWSRVFSGKSSRLVRLASWQHVNTYWTNLLLGYMNLSHSVDALATAPYFGYEATSSMTLDQIMAALPDEVRNSVDLGIQQKALAQKYGLKYMTYEAGQGVLVANLALEQQVERDPRMHDAYQQFLSSWQSQVGGGLNLFALEGQISQYGGWGLSEYIGQPVAQAPKLRAVDEYLGIKAPR